MSIQSNCNVVQDMRKNGNGFKMDIVEGSWSMFLVLDRSQIKCRLGKKESLKRMELQVHLTHT